MRWIQKIVDDGADRPSIAYAVLDADAHRLSIPLAGVSENDAAAMVATGAWKYVYELDRGEPARSRRLVS